MPKHKVRLYYSTYITAEVEADNRDDAIEVARSEISLDGDEEVIEALANLEPWEAIDEAEQIDAEAEDDEEGV